MTFPSSQSSLGDTLLAIRNNVFAVKSQAQSALATLQGGSVTTIWVFQFLDQMSGLISALNTWKTVAGLDAFATAQIPGYAGTLTSDIMSVVNAGQACIDWVVANFPKDNTAVWILAFQLNASGTRSPRSFTTAQTAGLQTALQTFIATIG